MFRRFLTQKPRSETPTATLYFTEAMKEHLASDGAVTRIEATVFRHADLLVVVRHWSKPTLELLEREQGLGVIYLIDDDLWAGDEEQNLPLKYRRRLTNLREDFDTQLSERVRMVVSPSPQILTHFTGVKTRLLDPGLIYPLADLKHHDQNDRPLKLVFSATSSHLSDLELIADELAAFLSGKNGVELTTFLGRQAPRALRLASCTHHEPQSWEEFRRNADGCRFHIGLAPVIDTAFNRGRSISRLFDHAAMGAVGLYSDVPPFSDRIDDGRDGILLPNTPSEWVEKIAMLKADAGLRKTLAEGAQHRSRALGQLDRVRAFWCDVLGI